MAMDELMDFIADLSIGNDGRVIPLIKFDDIPEKYVKTVFDNGIASIVMTVYTSMGQAAFEGYINGEYVPFSRDANISVTARRVNRELEERNK